jgi:hypothetical protein
LLQTALLEAKELWLAMNLSTLQPKWHLTFYGHLLEQFNRYGGLADKSDETIEKWHQTLKTLRDRFRGITLYEQKETCVRRELCRGQSPEIQQHIDKYEASIKQSDATKRARDTGQFQGRSVCVCVTHGDSTPAPYKRPLFSPLFISSNVRDTEPLEKKRQIEYDTY